MLETCVCQKEPHCRYSLQNEVCLASKAQVSLASAVSSYDVHVCIFLWDCRAPPELSDIELI